MDASQDLEANPESAGDEVVVSWGFLAAPLRFIMLSRYDRTCGARRSADFSQVTSASAEPQDLTSTELPHRESRLTEQIGGQLAAGFTLTHLVEAPHHADATAPYMPGYFATRAIKPEPRPHAD